MLPWVLLTLAAMAAQTADARTSVVLTELLTVELAQQPDVDVLSSEDLRRMIAFEAEKSALGCQDDDSCLAEVAGALGAQLVVHGVVTAVGQTLYLSLSTFDARNGRTGARLALQAETLGALTAQLTGVGDRLLAGADRPEGDRLRVLVLDLRVVEAAPAVAPAATSVASPVDWLLVGGALLGAAGLAVVSGGAGLTTWSGVTHQQAVAARFQDDAIRLYDARDVQSIGGAVLLSVGLVAVVGGGALAVYRVVESQP